MKRTDSVLPEVLPISYRACARRGPWCCGWRQDAVETDDGSGSCGSQVDPSPYHRVQRLPSRAPPSPLRSRLRSQCQTRALLHRPGLRRPCPASSSRRPPDPAWAGAPPPAPARWIRASAPREPTPQPARRRARWLRRCGTCDPAPGGLLAAQRQADQHARRACAMRWLNQSAMRAPCSPLLVAACARDRPVGSRSPLRRGARG